MSEDTSDGFADARREVGRLLERRLELLRQLSEINTKVNAHKVKCPTCRCQILPWAECVCCAEGVEGSAI